MSNIILFICRSYTCIIFISTICLLIMFIFLLHYMLLKHIYNRYYNELFSLFLTFCYFSICFSWLIFYSLYYLMLLCIDLSEAIHLKFFKWWILLYFFKQSETLLQIIELTEGWLDPFYIVFKLPGIILEWFHYSAKLTSLIHRRC